MYGHSYTKPGGGLSCDQEGCALIEHSANLPRLEHDAGDNSRGDARFVTCAALAKHSAPKPDFRRAMESSRPSLGPQLTMEDCLRNVAVSDLISPIDRSWSQNAYRFHSGQSVGLSVSQNISSRTTDDGDTQSRHTTSDSSAYSSSGVFSDDHITSTMSDSPRSPLRQASTRDVTTHRAPSTDSEAKPPQSYIALIAVAILESSDRRLILADIYQHALDNHPYYRSSTCAWRNSIRHNLSVNECFLKSGRARSGRGFFWSVHDACIADFERGDFNRRQARSRVQYASRTLVGGRPTIQPTEASRHRPLPASYVPMTSTPARGYLPRFHGYDHVSPTVLCSDYVTHPMTFSHANLMSSHYPLWPPEEPFYSPGRPTLSIFFGGDATTAGPDTPNALQQLAGVDNSYDTG